MTAYQEYSPDIWDYIKDMPYMPSREDRDRLVKMAQESDDEEKRADAEKRVAIWDYFFRIRESDVGKPQRAEIENIKAELEEAAAELEKTTQRIEGQIRQYREEIDKIRRSRRQRGWACLLIALLIIAIAGALFSSVVSSEGGDAEIERFSIVVTCGAPIALICGIVGLASLAASAGSAKLREIEKLEQHLRDEKAAYEQKVMEGKERVAHLESEIEELKRHIPEPPDGETVHKWLKEDLARLERDAIKSSGLENRIKPIRLELEDGTVLNAPNPLPISGPGELQREIPQLFKADYSQDYAKHLRARRPAYVRKTEGMFGWEIEMLHGVYFIEYIMVADDMLATCGLFFDFITGRVTAEQITEQYYNDVVAIATVKEFRTIDLGDGESWSIEDAPTFSLSLASGERRTVTFVNQDYFTGIKSKIVELTQDLDESTRINWVSGAEQVADSAVKAIRYYLRLHKGMSDEQ